MINCRITSPRRFRPTNWNRARASASATTNSSRPCDAPCRADTHSKPFRSSSSTPIQDVSSPPPCNRRRARKSSNATATRSISPFARQSSSIRRLSRPFGLCSRARIDRLYKKRGGNDFISTVEPRCNDHPSDT